MRIIPVTCIKEGMKLGKNLYGSNGEILLKRNTSLNRRYINRLKVLGYNAVYIEDELSSDIEIKDIINEELKSNTVQSVKGIYNDLLAGNMKGSAKKHNELKDIIDNILDDMLANNNLVYNMLDLKVFDDYTFFHCVNVAILSIIVGVGMKIKRNALSELALGALMHDIGKVYIPINIINKPEKLTTEEYEKVKLHSVKGYEYLKEILQFPYDSCEGVLMHHERYDGKGYPNGYTDKDITLYGKIMAICDVYDAIASDRPYRKAFSPSEAVEYIMANSGLMFNPEITKVFLLRIAPYPVGMIVRLSDNRTGIIVKNYPDMCLRPKIKIFRENNHEVKPYIIDLSKDKQCLNITIANIVEM